MMMNANLDGVLRSTNPSNVILSTMGPVYLDGETFWGKDADRVKGLVVTHYDYPDVRGHWKIFELGLRDTIEKLTDEGDHNVIFVIDNPELGIDFGCQPKNKTIKLFGLVVRDLITEPSAASCKIPRSEYDLRTMHYREFVGAIMSDYPKIKLFDPTDLFCDDDWCYGYKEELGYLYSDIDHLSENGSLMVGREIIKHLF